MKHIFFVVFSLLSTISSIAQQPIPVLQSIFETRNTSDFRAQCQLNVDLENGDTSGMTLYYLDDVISATDDLGNKLLLELNLFTDIYYSHPFLRIYLTNPSRHAKYISKLEIEYSVVAPSEEVGSKIVVKNLLNNYNKNLISQRYPHLELKLLDEKSLKAMKEKSQKDYEKKVEEAKNGSIVDAMAASLGAAFGEALEGLFPNGTNGQNLNFYVKEEKEEILRIYILDGKGKIMGKVMPFRHSDFAEVELDREPQADWQAVILILDPESTQKYRYTLENLELP